MNNKLIVWIFMIVFLLFTVTAVKPAPEVQTGGTLTIEMIQVEYFLYNDTNSKINIHVYNSTGYYLDNTTTTCLIHIYNNTGRHVVEDNMTMDSNLIDFQYTLPISVTSVEGIHAYVIQCSNAKEAGFVGGRIDILRGSSTIDDPAAYLPLILVLAFLILAMFIIGIGLKDDHAPLKLFMYWLGILLFIPLAQVGVTIAQAEYMSPSIITMANLFAYITIFMGIFASAYFMIYLLTKLLMTASEVAKNKLRKA